MVTLSSDGGGASPGAAPVPRRSSPTESLDQFPQLLACDWQLAPVGVDGGLQCAKDLLSLVVRNGVEQREQALLQVHRRPGRHDRSERPSEVGINDPGAALAEVPAERFDLGSPDPVQAGGPLMGVVSRVAGRQRPDVGGGLLL